MGSRRDGAREESAISCSEQINDYWNVIGTISITIRNFDANRLRWRSPSAGLRAASSWVRPACSLMIINTTTRGEARRGAPRRAATPKTRAYRWETEAHAATTGRRPGSERALVVCACVRACGRAGACAATLPAPDATGGSDSAADQPPPIADHRPALTRGHGHPPRDRDHPRHGCGDRRSLATGRRHLEILEQRRSAVDQGTWPAAI